MGQHQSVLFDRKVTFVLVTLQTALYDVVGRLSATTHLGCFVITSAVKVG
jgi:hypothetical protein